MGRELGFKHRPEDVGYDGSLRPWQIEPLGGKQKVPLAGMQTPAVPLRMRKEIFEDVVEVLPVAMRLRLMGAMELLKAVLE